jgi:hypothetical protein
MNMFLFGCLLVVLVVGWVFRNGILLRAMSVTGKFAKNGGDELSVSGQVSRVCSKHHFGVGSNPAPDNPTGYGNPCPDCGTVVTFTPTEGQKGKT